MSGLVAPFDDYQRLKYLRLQTSGPVRSRLTLARVLAIAVLLFLQSLPVRIISSAFNIVNRLAI
jgi:hypothetical protein